MVRSANLEDLIVLCRSIESKTNISNQGIRSDLGLFIYTGARVQSPFQPLLTPRTAIETISINSPSFTTMIHFVLLIEFLMLKYVSFYFVLNFLNLGIWEERPPTEWNSILGSCALDMHVEPSAGIDVPFDVYRRRESIRHGCGDISSQGRQCFPRGTDEADQQEESQVRDSYMAVEYTEINNCLVLKKIVLRILSDAEDLPC